jgi:hypothetical protein
MQQLLFTDSLVNGSLQSVIAAWSQAICETYGSAIRPFSRFCVEQDLAPLKATLVTVAWFLTWLGDRGTIKASSFQPYISVVNGFLRDHGA